MRLPTLALLSLSAFLSLVIIPSQALPTPDSSSAAEALDVRSAPLDPRLVPFLSIPPPQGDDSSLPLSLLREAAAEHVAPPPPPPAQEKRLVPFLRLGLGGANGGGMGTELERASVGEVLAKRRLAPQA